MKPQPPETIELQELLFGKEDLNPETPIGSIGEDCLEIETFYVDGFSNTYNLAGLRKGVQQYANKFHNGIGLAETNVANGKKFFLKYLSRAKQDDVAALKQMLRKHYPQFLNKITE